MKPTTTKKLVTESDLLKLVCEGTRRLEIPKGTLMTPLALDLAKAKGIEISFVAVQPPPPKTPPQVPAASPPSLQRGARGIVAFGADHGGFQLKQTLIKHAVSLGYEAMDLGTNSEEPCDYPDYAYAVGKAVTSGIACCGVVIDGAGIGSCIAANKVPNVRAACCHNEFVARNAREHNDANVLTLGSRVTGVEVCKEILGVWLETGFAGGRHQQRVDKVLAIEARHSRTPSP